MEKDQLQRVLHEARSGSWDKEKTVTELRIKLNLFVQAFHHLNDTAMPKDGISDGVSHYFIPFPPTLFADILIDGFCSLGMDRNKRFLDVGCGIGSTVLLALSLFDAYGFDFDSSHVEVGSRMLGKRIFQADAFEFGSYGDFDFIYYFRPIYQPDLYTQLESRIYDQLKPGALIAPMDSLFHWDDVAEPVGEFLYRKV